MSTPHRTIGRNPERLGARERLQGRPLFCADLELADPLILKAFRSPKAHARIGALRMEKALSVEGVIRIFTATDIPGRNALGIINKDQPLLAEDKVRFVGEPVALVAAESESAAERALDLLEVDWQDLPAVLDPEEALATDAPRIHEKGNLLFRRQVRKGDVEAAFEDCHVVVERTYQTPMLEHAYLEPDAGLGRVDEDGTLVIYASTQNPHYDHKELVDLLALPEDRVRIIQAATGGGFGSKLDLNVQGFIGLALLYLKRPVRYVYTREEAFLATAKRHPLTITMKTGADRHGKLRAVQARIVCDTGAYGSYGIAVASRAAVHATGPYEIEHVDVDSMCVYTNHVFCGAMRGFGTPQIAFAHESQIDLVARELALDPLEIRRLNALKPGSSTGTGQKLTHSVGIGTCIERVAAYYAEARARCAASLESGSLRRGVGLGAMWYGIGNTGVQNPSTARMEVDEHGSLTLYTGCADIGQGSTTVLAQIAAESLGMSPETLKIVTADTQRTPNAGATSASRQTYISGNAVKQAADKLAGVLLAQAADMLGIPKEALILQDGFATSRRPDGPRVALAALFQRARRKGIPLVCEGYFDPETTPLDPVTSQGVPYATYAFACQVAEVVVDVLTGEVRVERVAAAHDVGKALYPEGVRGQICGGVAMGLGFALMETYRPGQTTSLKDYPIPTCADMPEVVPIIVEAAEPSGPFGAKGVGEPALIPTAPAIVNAIADALGKRLYSLPADLESVLELSVKAGHFAPKEE